MAKKKARALSPAALEIAAALCEQTHLGISVSDPNFVCVGGQGCP